MATEANFGVLLQRLADHRQLDIALLAQRAQATESEVHRAVGGEAPTPSLLRRLAPVLGLHAADLFVSAGVAVPDDPRPGDCRGTIRHRTTDRPRPVRIRRARNRSQVERKIAGRSRGRSVYWPAIRSSR